MRYKKVTLLIILLAILSICCETNERNDNVVVNLINPELNEYKLSNICDNLNYIVLDSEYKIKYVNEIQMDDGLIFCATQPEGVLSFNFKGDFLKKIGKRGRGPGEYQTGIRFCLDKKAKHIYIDNGVGEILKYNYQGDFIKEIEIKSKVLPGFIDFSDNYFIFSYPIITSITKSPFQWIVADTLTNVVSQKINDNYTFDGDGPSPSGTLTYIFKNKIHYWNHYNDTIFQITSQSYKTKYILNKGELGLSPKKVSKLKNFNDIKDYINIRRIIECDSFLFIIYNLQNRRRIVLFDKFQKISYELKSAPSQYVGFINNIDGGPNFLPFRLVGNSTLVMPIDAYTFSKMIKSKDFKNCTPKYPEKKKELEKLANSLDENDNPVLMLVKLKE